MGRESTNKLKILVKSANLARFQVSVANKTIEELPNLDQNLLFEEMQPSF